MAVHNGWPFVEDSVSSILKQTLTNFEFLIMDDGSDDGTEIILQALAQKDSRVRLYHRANAGLTSALNELMSKAHAPFIARMDADDVSHPARLAAQFELLRCDPDSGIVGCGVLLVDEMGGPLGGRCYPNDHKLLSTLLKRGKNPFFHGSTMLRREVLDGQGPYRFRYGQDFDLWLRLSGKTRMGMVEKTLYAYRMTASAVGVSVGSIRQRMVDLMLELHSQRQAHQPEGDWELAERDILDDLVAPTEEDKTCLSKYNRGRALFREGRFAEARHCFLQTVDNPASQLDMKWYLLLSYFPKRLGLGLHELSSWLGDPYRKYSVSRRTMFKLRQEFRISGPRTAPPFRSNQGLSDLAEA